MRIALGVEYQGTNYHGWQKQKSGLATIQKTLEGAIGFVANHDIELYCAGRTDRGVHGIGQVVHFDTPATRDENAWLLGINSRLPIDIRVTWVRFVDDIFHARFSAKNRRYCYIIHQAAVKSAIFANLFTHSNLQLDYIAMDKATQVLLGEHDFSAFRAAKCQSNTPYRCIEYIQVSKNGEFIIVDIQANAFLYHMVRNIVGSLLLIGQEKKPIDWLEMLLLSKDRKLAAATAPATGLYLVDVGYDLIYNFPKNYHHFAFYDLNLTEG